MKFKNKSRQTLLKKYNEWLCEGRNDYKMKHLIGKLRQLFQDKRIGKGRIKS